MEYYFVIFKKDRSRKQSPAYPSNEERAAAIERVRAALKKNGEIFSMFSLFEKD